jgi:hypothetical protein
MSCFPFRRLFRSCRRFFHPKRFPRVAYLIELLELYMAALDALKASTDSLAAAVAANTSAIDAAIAALGSPVSGVARS